MPALLEEIKNYWARRAPSYSEEVNREQSAGKEEQWVGEMQKYLPPPGAQVEFLKAAGFSDIAVDTSVWERVWDAVQKANNGSTPCFLLRAIK